jgi:hypothetical protein
MADKKYSELTIKSTIVPGDLIPILDSETAVGSEKNKMVTPSTLKDFIATQGTWTPTVTGVSVTNSIGYSQINGNMVTLMFSFTMPTTASGAAFIISNAPVPSAAFGVGKPLIYYGIITRFVGTNTDQRLEFAENSSSLKAPGRDLSYFSNTVVAGSITYIKE